MRQRISVLTRYFLRTLFTSLPGSIYAILTLAYWAVFFNPQQQTPDMDYFILVGGIFGPIAAFLITLTIASRANQAIHYPFIVRLHSRIEYLTAVLISTLIAATGLQILLALLGLIFGGPDITFSGLIGIPPIWLALNVLATVIALHASDFVTRGWSRIYIFGSLAIFLFGQGINNEALVRATNSISQYATNQGWYEISGTLSDWANSLSSSGNNTIGQFFSILFWPFRAITDAVVLGNFTTVQALAPAIIFLYATILFLIAADLFANKDLAFTE
ncbi:MAG: hypothetical protein GY943_16285 [Chloroflexi bacterium]|nr:hypothetical protein [Chloroflexota bacterium]